MSRERERAVWVTWAIKLFDWHERHNDDRGIFLSGTNTIDHAAGKSLFFFYSDGWATWATFSSGKLNSSPFLVSYRFQRQSSLHNEQQRTETAARIQGPRVHPQELRSRFRQLRFPLLGVSQSVSSHARPRILWIPSILCLTGGNSFPLKGGIQASGWLRKRLTATNGSLLRPQRRQPHQPLLQPPPRPTAAPPRPFIHHRPTNARKIIPTESFPPRRVARPGVDCPALLRIDPACTKSTKAPRTSRRERHPPRRTRKRSSRRRTTTTLVNHSSSTAGRWTWRTHQERSSLPFSNRIPSSLLTPAWKPPPKLFGCDLCVNVWWVEPMQSSFAYHWECWICTRRWVCWGCFNFSFL